MPLWSQSQSSFMNEPAEAANPALPLFYKRVAVVDEAKLSNSSLKEQIGYDFARDTAIVPLIVTELFTAASTYPIVFITEPVPSVLAVLGLRQAQNLFVSGDGSKWDAPYVPAYVRRYPFVFLRHDNDDLTLCIDEAANALEPGRARPLFEDGKRTPRDRARPAVLHRVPARASCDGSVHEGADRAGSPGSLPDHVDSRLGRKTRGDRLQGHR